MSALPSIDALMAQLTARGITLPPGPVHADGFGDSAELSEELLALIRSGRKRAGAGLLWAYEHDGDHISRVGDIEIVVDHLNAPAMVTRIVSAEITPFNEVTAEYAALEGEGDGSLEYWRRAHWNFFSRECKRIGKQPTESMLVRCSVFEVLHLLPPLSTT
ncbi:MAG: ASCH domain-containing protein [Burkholderiales bacterium]|nr:ASCH domain-containing protein [Burkholderiales bacterium]